MTKLSFFDKLKVLLEVSQTSKLFILVIIFLVFLAFMFFTTNKKNVKNNKKICLVIYTFILLFIIISYHSSLNEMFDYMMNNFFIAVYFPNLAIYLAAIIITNIILWVSVFNFKTAKIIKNINITIYCIISYLLILILNVITKNNLDVFTQSSVYGNTDAQALIELSSIIFITWIAFLVIYKLIRKYQSKDEKDKKIVVVKKVQKTLPNNVAKVKVPNYVTTTKKVTKEKKIVNSTQEFDNLLTVDDYKLLLKILKEQKEKERQEEERRKRVELEQVKYRELQELYRK